MAQKIIGSTLLLIGAIGICCNILRMQKDNAIELRELKNSLLRVTQKICRVGVPILEIVEEEKERTHGNVKVFYMKLNDTLCDEVMLPLEEAVAENLHKVKKYSSVSAEAWELFSEAFIIAVTQSDTGNERAMDSYLQGLEDLICINRKESAQQRKVTFAISLMGAAFVICVLI